MGVPERWGFFVFKTWKFQELGALLWNSFHGGCMDIFWNGKFDRITTLKSKVLYLRSYNANAVQSHLHIFWNHKLNQDWINLHAHAIHTYHMYMQRSKLTFSKSHLLATFNCKMVAIKNSVAKKKENVKGRTLHDILHVTKKYIVHEWLMRRTARFQHFTLLQ